MRLLNLLVATLLTLSPLALHAEIETQEFDATKIKEIVITNGTGNVEVSSSSNPKTVVTADKKIFETGCQLTMMQGGSKLEVTVDQKRGSPLAKCEVSLVISGPQNIAVRANLGSGDLKIRGTIGKVTLKTGSGSVDIESTVTQLNAEMGSGAITISGLTAEEADVKIGSGPIKLSYAKVPDNGALEIRSGSGEATVTLPANSKVQTDFKAGIGQLSNELGETPNARFVISAKTGNGNLAIKKAM